MRERRGEERGKGRDGRGRKGNWGREEREEERGELLYLSSLDGVKLGLGLDVEFYLLLLLFGTFDVYDGWP